MMSPIKPPTHQILDLSRARDWVKYSDESKSRCSFIGDKLTHSFFKSQYMMPEVRLGQIAPNHRLPTGILLLLLLSTRLNSGESPGNMLGICYDFTICLPYLDRPHFFLTNPRCHNDIIMTSPLHHYDLTFTYDLTMTSLPEHYKYALIL